MGIVFSHVIAAGLYFYRNGRILTSEHDQNNPHRPQESDNLNSEYEVGATNSDDFFSSAAVSAGSWVKQKKANCPLMSLSWWRALGATVSAHYLLLRCTVTYNACAGGGTNGYSLESVSADGCNDLAGSGNYHCSTGPSQG
ncbi:hypothetical protein RRG08_005699 [Elysia crispata]|uniref:Uncharacterized protein n=1 Tax=Elysia crispata TaxID=231223 RepID=A0AAE0YDG4_9GAST|nr:hypothetical protein RRG08_005699 [Elysia crispata]